MSESRFRVNVEIVPVVVASETEVFHVHDTGLEPFYHGDIRYPTEWFLKVID